MPKVVGDGRKSFEKNTKSNVFIRSSKHMMRQKSSHVLQSTLSQFSATVSGKGPCSKWRNTSLRTSLVHQGGSVYPQVDIRALFNKQTIDGQARHKRPTSDVTTNVFDGD
jgi:hypothetical protein